MPEIEPTEGQIEAFTKEWRATANEGGDSIRAGLRAALNYEEPLTPEDAKYDFALQATDSVSGDGTYAEVNFHNPNPMVQRAINRWRNRES